MRKRRIFQLLGPISSFVARQLALPSGWFGRLVMTRFLNRGNRDLITATLDQRPLNADTRLLDVGFGGGLGLQLARQRGVRHLVGIDPSRDAVEVLKASSNRWIDGGDLAASEGSVGQLPLAEGAVDAIISTNTVYFWPDLARAFAELRRVLAPGGRLAIGFSSSEKLRAFSTITRHGFLLYDNAEIVAQAERAGLRSVQLVALDGPNTAGDYVLCSTNG